MMQNWLIDWARFNIPPNTLYVISGAGFYESNDPTNNVKALNEDRVLRIRLQSNQVHPATLTIIQQLCSMKQKHKIHTNTNKSTHSEMGPVWQNPIQNIVRTAHLSVLMTVHSFITWSNTEHSDNLPCYLQTTIKWCRNSDSSSRSLFLLSNRKLSCQRLQFID